MPMGKNERISVNPMKHFCRCLRRLHKDGRGQTLPSASLLFCQEQTALGQQTHVSDLRKKRLLP